MKYLKTSLLIIIGFILVSCQKSVELKNSTYETLSSYNGGIKFLDEENCTIISDVVSSLIVNCIYEVEAKRLTVFIKDIDKDFVELETYTKLYFNIDNEKLVLTEIEPNNDYYSTPNWEANEEFILKKEN